VGTLEEENASINVKGGKYKEIMHLVTPRGYTGSGSPISPGKDGETTGISIELNRVKQLYAQAVQDLEKERTKLQSVDLLVNQIKILTAPVTSELSSNQSGDAEEKRILLKKLLEEKEAHSSTLQTLNDERKKSQNDREYMDSLSQRIKDLIQSHSNTLKQLEEERDSVRKGKDIVKDMQTEIKGLKSEKRGKLLVLSSVGQDIEVSPLMSEEDDIRPNAKQATAKQLINSSDSESSGKSSPVTKNPGRVFVPECKITS
jgi:chromosome segregation ATPase